MFIGTQCDLWGKPDGTGHEKGLSQNEKNSAAVLFWLWILKIHHCVEKEANFSQIECT